MSDVEVLADNYINIPLSAAQIAANGGATKSERLHRPTLISAAPILRTYGAALALPNNNEQTISFFYANGASINISTILFYVSVPVYFSWVSGGTNQSYPHPDKIYHPGGFRSITIIKQAVSPNGVHTMYFKAVGSLDTVHFEVGD